MHDMMEQQVPFLRAFTLKKSLAVTVLLASLHHNVSRDAALGYIFLVENIGI